VLARSRDLDATRRRLTAWLAAKLPGATNVSLSTLTAPGSGFSNETYLAEATWDAQAGRQEASLVIRLDPAEYAVFPAYDLMQQCRILRALAGTRVPVPRVRWMEMDRDILGSAFYVMDRVTGDIPPDVPPYHAVGVCVDAAPERRARLWWAGIETLARIHALDWQALRLEFLGVPPAGEAALDPQLAYYAAFLDDVARAKPQPILAAALAWLRANRYAPEHIALCWGDSRLPNMVFRDDTVVAVLDWEMASLGDPEADLGWWIFLDWANSEGFGIARLAGFPTAAETIARYQTLTGRAVRQARYHEVWAAFRYGVILARVAVNLRAAGVPIGAPDLATNNPCTRRLAHLLGLPTPVAGGAAS
jgi:aminoglycoside phosphotransferase (APT) family kinase protein